MQSSLKSGQSWNPVAAVRANGANTTTMSPMSSVYNLRYAEHVPARYAWISQLELSWQPGPLLYRQCGFNVGHYVATLQEIGEDLADDAFPY